MPLTRKPMRYAHPEGHTDVCYFSGDKRGLVTCGSDGDVRYWLNLMDDDPASSCISEQAIAVVSKGGKIFVGNDNNTVQILTHPDLEKEGIVTRYSAPISALSSTPNSNFIASGSCDMRIQVTDIITSDSIELEGHEAPILGLSLDPKEQFVASSSADGSIRIWNIKEKKVVHAWNNVVPKCNSFFTAKSYSVPSFQPKNGDTLAYPHNKDVIVVERSTWKEIFKLRCAKLKSELSICKFSECGTKLAASSVHGEIVVWHVESKEVVGYIEHQQNVKITSLAWHPDKPDEIAFCDSHGQLGCVEVIHDETTNEEEANMKEVATEFGLENDDDGENTISLSEIKASVELDDDQKSQSDTASDKPVEDKLFMPEVHMQPPFQPGSSPSHLLSRYMVWNDIGIVRCFTSEDGENSNIEVEFHDATVHHGIYINNYLRHNIAALSSQALALNCPPSEDAQSKLVVIAFRGWGTGNKEWSLELPEGEEGHCLAAGDNFVALATSRRNLRIFTVGGTQREVIAMPGPVVAVNALGNHLVAVYHDGVGSAGDQKMSMFWMQIRGTGLRNQTLSVPLSPSSDLMWLGLSDMGSPSLMDAEDIIRIYDKKSSLWKVACDLNGESKGKTDHYFVIGLSEEHRIVRCILCKGSYYPPTTPRSVTREAPLMVPLCDPGSEKSAKEAKLWQIGSDPMVENEAVLFLFALACRNNIDYRAVELCEQIASEKVLELAIKYATRMNRMALVRKLESIADKRDEEKESKDQNDKDNNFEDDKENEEDKNELILKPVVEKPPEIEIKPLPMNETFSVRRNPFSKTNNSPSTKGLDGLNAAIEKPKSSPAISPTVTKAKPAKKESFVSWYSKNKKDMLVEFPELSNCELSKIALARYREENMSQSTEDSSESKKRKLSSPESEPSNNAKRTTKTLSDFAFCK